MLDRAAETPANETTRRVRFRGAAHGLEPQRHGTRPHGVSNERRAAQGEDADGERRTRCPTHTRAAVPLPDGMELRIGDCRVVLSDIPDNSVPLIVTDPFLASSGHLERATVLLDRTGIGWRVFSETVADPTTAVVEAGAAFLAGGDFDSLIAIGGGSSIDTAKGVSVLAANGGLGGYSCTSVCTISLRAGQFLSCVDRGLWFICGWDSLQPIICAALARLKSFASLRPEEHE